MSDSGITMDEWKAELDAVRGYKKKIRFTQEMDDLLIYARTPDKYGKVVSYKTIVNLFVKRGWFVTLETLRRRREELKVIEGR